MAVAEGKLARVSYSADMEGWKAEFYSPYYQAERTYYYSHWDDAIRRVLDAVAHFDARKRMQEAMDRRS